MRAQIRSRQAWFGLITLTFVLLLGAVTVSAQAAEPITIGENKTGQIVDAQTPARYSIQLASPMSIQVQVLAISQGFAPTFRVLDPSGVMILSATNPGTQTIVQGAPNLSTSGVYTIEVNSANGATGQFLLSVQAGAPLAPPQPLTPGVALNGSLNQQNSRLAYSFTGVPNDILLLLVRSSAPTGGPVVSLRDGSTGETLAVNSARLAGALYRIPANGGSFVVDVSFSGINPSEGFVICLATESGTATCPGVGTAQNVVPTAITVPTLIPTFTPSPTQGLPPTFAPVVINPTGPCLTASARGATINIRSAPGTDFSVVGQLQPTIAIPVIGRLPDNSWFQVNSNGTIGWVSATVVILGGNCAGVSIVQPPTATSTVIPPATTPEVGATATATATATPDGAAPQLNYGLSPVFGSSTITSGFVPDPFYVPMTAGGPASASYLGGSCNGYMTSAPSYSFNFTSGTFPTLRFYFVGGGDTTMIINAPNANFYCADDSFNSVDPTIDFSNPSSGRYDVWIGTYSAGGSISGTLYVTENTNNHP